MAAMGPDIWQMVNAPLSGAASGGSAGDELVELLTRLLTLGPQSGAEAYERIERQRQQREDELRSRERQERESQRLEARERGDVAGLSDTQRGWIATQRSPTQRAQALATSTMVNRMGPLGRQGLNPALKGEFPQRPGESEAEYVARVKREVAERNRRRTAEARARAGPATMRMVSQAGPGQFRGRAMVEGGPVRERTGGDAGLLSRQLAGEQRSDFRDAWGHESFPSSIARTPEDELLELIALAL